LIGKGVAKERIRLIAPGDVFSVPTFEIRVLKGKHIVNDKRLIAETLFNPRVLLYWRNLSLLAKENRICAEAGETVCYDISVSGKRVLVLGSLNLADDADYPKEADLLILPFQGRSDMGVYAMPFISRLRPKRVMLTHFDDTFPPVSRRVKTEPFAALMRREYPAVPVIVPAVGAEWIELD
jgi:L-ascorbate metabolism protein UlaG (beta-lactamase superfamily)